MWVKGVGKTGVLLCTVACCSVSCGKIQFPVLEIYYFSLS